MLLGIFQRAIDDVFKEHIGKYCLIYSDNEIIFSQNKEDYLKRVEAALKSLLEANMRVSVQKS